MCNILGATIFTGPLKGEDVVIPWIPVIPTDMGMVSIQMVCNGKYSPFN